MTQRVALPMMMLLALVASGCAGVPKMTAVASDVGKDRQERKQEIVRDYEMRRNEVQYQAAVSKMQQGDTQGARRDITLLLERAPKHRAANLLACEIALETKNPALAATLASQLISRDANDAAAHHTLGLALDAQGRLAEAKPHYHKALELDTKNEIFAASWQLANAPEPHAEPTAEQSSGVQLVSYSESDDSADTQPLALGHQALASGDVTKAERQYATAMSAAPHNPDIPREAALRLLQHNETAGAVRLLGHACRRFPRSVPLLRTLATAHYRQGDYESSQVALRQALSLDNRDALSYFLMGAVREKLGDHRGAAQSTAKARELRSATSAHR